MHRADNLTTFMCRPSWNFGTSNSWNTQALSWSVMGLLCLYLCYITWIFYSSTFRIP